MKIRNMKEVEAALLPFVPLVGQMSSKHITLDRIKPLMELLGNPEDRLRVVHIAGTSGKTSTAYYAAALLSATGKKVGLTVSPHVDTVAERVQINGQGLPEAEFCAELSVFLELVAKAKRQPSCFELLYAFALWVFGRQQVDYAVVETGMGGLVDATNVADRADKVCVITDIGYDHTHILGKTLAEITSQKIGIVHNKNVIFMYQQAPEIMKVVRQWTNKQSARLYVCNQKTEALSHKEDLASMPNYQARNWLLAYRTYRYLMARDNLQHLTREVLQKTQQLQVPARMDKRTIKGKTLVMDGAHNVQKMTAFLDSFKQQYPDTKPAILLALKEGKEYQELTTLLAALGGPIIVTIFKMTQDLPVESMDPEVLSKGLLTAGAKNVRVIINQRLAFQTLLALPQKVCIITGSFYLLGQIRDNEHLA